MRTYLAPDTDMHARERERLQRLRDRFRDTMRGRARNKMLQPIEDDVHDVTFKGRS